MKLKILVDNKALPGFKSEWGFSCLVGAGENILFDVGASSAVLSFNAEKFGIKPGQIDKLVLSHDHFDHTGGLQWAVQNKNLRVFVLNSFSEQTKEKIKREATLVEVDEPVEIIQGVYSTGKLSNSTDEQSLAIETKKGLVVLTGCAHPGLGKILKAVESLGRIHALVGGFHGFSEFEALDKIDIISAAHCTSRKEEIARLFAANFVECGAGKEFIF